jgi:hypothetical protein
MTSIVGQIVILARFADAFQQNELQFARIDILPLAFEKVGGHFLLL